MGPNNDKNPKLNDFNDDFDDNNFLQVATAIPTRPTQIPSVRSISFANSVNVYNKVGHHHLRVFFISIFRLWLRRKLTKCKWFLPKKTGMASYSGPQLLTFYWRNARNVNVSRQAASAIPMLSILMSCVPAMSSASTVNVSHLVSHQNSKHIGTFTLDQVATVTSTLLIQTAFVSLERFARWAS